MRTYHRRFYPTCTSCGIVVTSGDCCDKCMDRRAVPVMEPLCDAHGCTREIGRDEVLCRVHQRIADGHPPALSEWQTEDVYRRLGDPAVAMRETATLDVPGIGHVTLARRRLALDADRCWYEWQTVAA